MDADDGQGVVHNGSSKVLKIGCAGVTEQNEATPNAGEAEGGREHLAVTGGVDHNAREFTAERGGERLS